jgi:SynChlorMet cassette radical SAM/SPASM protein ScmE
MSLPNVPPTPRELEIAITGKCNLACQYCFYADEMVARTNLPTERWLTFFDELGNLGVMTVCLTGGEVFTRPDLFELIDGLTDNHMRYQLLSNGTLITEEILAKFEIGKRRQRLNYIQVSIDGSSTEVHDRSRPKSFQRALRGLKLLKKAGFPVTVRVTINRYNVDDLENVAHLLLDEVGLQSFGTNEAYACGATDRTENGIILSMAQREKAMDTLRRLSEQYDSRIMADAGPLSLVRELKMLDEMLTAGETQIPGRGTLSSCGGVFKKLGILHDGTIVPCTIMSSLRLGTIGEDSLQEIWLNHPTMIALRERRNIPLASLDSCRDCAYVGLCAGGCPAAALHTNDDFNTRNPLSCFRVIKGEEILPGING